MDDFAALRYFVAAVEGGSFSAAAAAAEVEVSTISRQIVALETDLKAALFNRSTRRMSLTEAGQLLYEYARRVLKDLGDAKQAVRDWNSQPQGVLRVGVSEHYGRRHAAAFLRGFLKRYPAIQVDLKFTSNDADIIEDSLDVLIRVGPLPDSALIARRFATWPLHLVAASDLPDLPTEIQQLSHTPAIGLRTAHDQQWACRLDTGQEIRDLMPAPRLRVHDLNAVHEAVCAGHGLGLLPSEMIRDDLATGKLRRLFATGEWAYRPFDFSTAWWVYPPKKTVSAKLRALIDHMGGDGRNAGAATAPGPPAS